MQNSKIPVHVIPDIIEGIIIARPSKIIKSPYVADVKIAGEEKLAHCPSLGLCGMIVPGSLVFMSLNQTKTKTDYKVHAVLVNERESKTEFTPSGDVIVGCDPILSNKIGKKLFFDHVDYFHPITSHKQEFTFKESRFDHYFESNDQKYYVEIKSVPTCNFCFDDEFLSDPTNKTLIRDLKKRCYEEHASINSFKRKAIFPDGYKKNKTASVSERANKHIQELTEVAKSGEVNPYLCFFVMRNDCYQFQTAWQVDPYYNELFNNALDAGVNIKVLKFEWKYEEGMLNIYYDGELEIVQHF